MRVLRSAVPDALRLRDGSVVDRSTIEAVAAVVVWLGAAAMLVVCGLRAILLLAKGVDGMLRRPTKVLLLILALFAAGEFSKAMNYMSARGYERWLRFQQSKVWR